MALMINWLAVTVATIVYFIIHFLWYFPFAFGNLWLRLVGKESEPKSKIIRDTIIMIPTSFFTVLFMEMMINLTGMNNIVSALILSIIIWIGFVATIAINQNNFNDRGVKLFLIEYGFYLVGFIIAAIMLVLFP
jgi:hypothetical protein